MTITDIIALLPFIALATASVVVMLVIAFYRNHKLTTVLTLAGFALSAASLPFADSVVPREVTTLLIIDRYALYYAMLILTAGMAVTALSYGYLERHDGHHEEFYLLLLLASLGCMVLAAATHFAAFFLGIEILSVSLYALAGYLRHSDRSVEAGVKYLILAAVSSAFILFGMALVYAETGSLAFQEVASRAASSAVYGPPFLAGLVMIIVGLGFKLAVVPFHLWTPDVYEGAPAPVTAFIATVSKGAVFALALRYFTRIDIHAHAALFLIITLIAVASMFAGNLLALLQTNVKRILAYSSISHLGYLLVTVLASGPTAVTAAAFYLAAYFITTLGAFGVVAVLSRADRDADRTGGLPGPRLEAAVARRGLYRNAFFARGYPADRRVRGEILRCGRRRGLGSLACRDRPRDQQRHRAVLLSANRRGALYCRRGRPASGRGTLAERQRRSRATHPAACLARCIPGPDDRNHQDDDSKSDIVKSIVTAGCEL